MKYCDFKQKLLKRKKKLKNMQTIIFLGGKSGNKLLNSFHIGHYYETGFMGTHKA